MIATILLVFAFVFFVLASLYPPQQPVGARLTNAGLAAWVLAEIFLRSGLLGR